MLQRFQRQNLSLCYYDNGFDAPALVFQHGLTGDHRQVLSSFLGRECRLIVLECRGHGGSDTGHEAELGIAAFADDLRALLQHLGVARAVFAGISMGAATVANFAVKHPGMISGLVLIRPSWFDRSGPENMAAFSVAADFYDLHGPDDGRRLFAESDCFHSLHEQSPDNAASLLNLFQRGPAKNTVPLLRRMLTCDPGLDLAALAELRVPIKVLGTRLDVIHPLKTAKRIAEAIPAAEFVELYPKSLDRDRHFEELTAVVLDCLEKAQEA